MDFEKTGNAAVNAMTLIQQLEDKVREKNKKIKSLEDSCMAWRTKFILSTMLNWANPFPLLVGLIVGGGVGAVVEYLIVRRIG
jgi:hypothetical protein